MATPTDLCCNFWLVVGVRQLRLDVELEPGVIFNFLPAQLKEEGPERKREKDSE